MNNKGIALRKRRVAGGLAGITAAAVVLGGAFAPTAAVALEDANVDDPSVAEAQILSLPAALLGDLELADLGNTITSFPSAPGPEDGGALNLTALEALSVDIGAINLPLLSNGTNNGLLQLGDLGAMGSYSSSPSTVNSSASSGLIASGGGIDAGAIDASTDPATLELTNLFDQLNVAGLTDGILDQASLSIGALASEASEDSGAVTSAYRIASLDLDLHSPAVADLSAGLTETVNDVVAPVNGLVGDGGLVSDVLSTLSGVINTFDLTVLGVGVQLDSDPTQSTAAITGLDTLVNDIVADLLAEQISNTNGSVVVDLSTGTIHVSLAELVIGDNGLDPSDLENLNALPANTEVLTPAVVTAITAGVTESLIGTGPDSLATKLQDALNTRIWNEVGIEIGLDASGQLCVIVCSTLADASVSITGTLAEFAGKDGATLGRDNIDTTLNLLGILDVGALLDELAPLLIAPITSTVTGPLLDLVTDDVLGNVRTIVQSGIVEGTLAPLLGVLSPVLDEIVNVTINEQPAEGDLGADSFTVRALSVDLLPAVGGGVSLDLAEASIKALDALAPTVDALDPVVAGTSLPVEGTGWVPGSTVTLQLTDGAGANVGEAVTVTVAADGTFPAGTIYAIPADAAAGTDYTLTASDPDGNTAEDTVEVTAADPGDVNTNAAASASASADATADGDPSAQAAAEAAALADATNAATAAANGDASIAAQAAATTDASTAASADSTTDVNAQASVAAQAAAQADASDDVAAAATALAEANSSVAAQAAATADSSTDASSEASTNANAAASASASANADATTDAVADVAAQAAAYADATAEATAAADSTAQAAASAAATATSSATATSDATSAANANAAVAAQAAALADASSDTAAEGSAAVNGNASSAAEAAAIADSSTDASVAATADADADADPAAAAEVNTNATASAAASAQADADNDAAAQAAAVAAALADASTAADAAATPDAEAAAASAATATATSAASADATTDANASAAVAAQAAAQADNSASTTADATAAAEADTAAAAAVAATATSSNDASATAAADAVGSTTATATADADADPTATATADADADPAAAAEVNTNATASAAASAQADADNAAAAQAAAVAAALADASTAADAAADPDAEAAAAAAATADVTADASVDATSEANAAAAVAAQASAQADNSASAAADTSAAATADADAAAAASAASTANSSASASANAAADSTAAATASAAATATASANASADADPASQLSVSVKYAKIERGEKQTATGTGFAPGEVVSGSSGSAALGTQVASAEGTVTFTWSIPSNAALGTHTVTLTAPESGSASASFQVVADGLATTGSDVPFGWIALGVLLLMLGLGTALVARSRRAVAAAE